MGLDKQALDKKSDPRRLPSHRVGDRQIPRDESPNNHRRSVAEASRAEVRMCRCGGGLLAARRCPDSSPCGRSRLNLSSRRGSKLLGEILSGVWLVGVPWPSANQGMSRRGFIDDNTESPGTDDACACFQRTKISARIHRPVTWRTDYIVPESPDLFFVQVLGAHD